MKNWTSLTMIALFAFVAGCGDGSICFGGDCTGKDDDDENTVSMSGNVDSTLPPNASRSTYVFVYTALDTADLADGPPFDVYKNANAVTVDSDDAFELSRLRRGRLTVIFSRDSEPEPNGTIDPGDECSVLLDGGDLSDVRGGQSVTLVDIDVEFSTTSCPTPPPAATCGCARADEIRVRTTPPGTE
jgi:hypothetical protein